MNNKLILGLLAGAGAFYYFLQGKKGAIEDLQIEPVDIAIDKESNFRKLVFNLKLQIKNPSKFIVKVKNIDLDLKVNNKTISNFNSNTVLSLPANSNKIYNIKISVNNLTVVLTILDLLDKKNIVAAIEGDITTDLGVVDINFKKEINF
jgi:LEA14-like dessication related protein